MKPFWFAMLACAVSAFAQYELHSAIDDGDLATAKKMIKSGEVEEVYCGKLSPKDAMTLYVEVAVVMLMDVPAIIGRNLRIHCPTEIVKGMIHFAILRHERQDASDQDQ